MQDAQPDLSFVRALRRMLAQMLGESRPCEAHVWNHEGLPKVLVKRDCGQTGIKYTHLEEVKQSDVDMAKHHFSLDRLVYTFRASTAQT